MLPARLLCLSLLITLAGMAQTSPDNACAPCHRDLYDRYQQTPMARASGSTSDRLTSPARYTHTPSQIDYTIDRTPQQTLQLRFLRTADPPLSGTRPLPYFIGSGKRGRTFLFATDGFWFQAPINFYTRLNAWEMAPGYSAVHHLPLDLAVDEGCLFCHTSGVRPSAPGTVNQFGARPFTDAGITCARCHGDPAAHLASAGKAPILNPAKLPAPRRDSLCAQCHLEGEVSVLLPDRRPSSFKPGDDLFDSVAYFVHAAQGDLTSRTDLAGPDNLSVRAVSEVEALAQSVCKRRSGDRLACTSCHDPHGTVAPDNRVAWYRARCLACHTAPAVAVQHHPEQPDCTACHMPTRPTTDIAHEQATDHRILKRQPSVHDQNLDPDPDPDTPSSRLVPVLTSRHTPRELGLAYASFARKGDIFSLGESVHLLRTALTSTPTDPAITFTLATLLDAQGDTAAAETLYIRTFQLDPLYPGAAVKAADIALRRNDLPRAATLWQQALAHNPTDSAVAQRLASAQCTLNDRAAARHTLEQALRFSPDGPASPAIRATLASWQASPSAPCTLAQGAP